MLYGSLSLAQTSGDFRFSDTISGIGVKVYRIDFLVDPSGGETSKSEGTEGRGGANRSERELLR